MREVLENIKEMLQNKKNEEAIKYIDAVLSKNKNIDDYMDELVNDLK